MEPKTYQEFVDSFNECYEEYITAHCSKTERKREKRRKRSKQAELYNLMNKICGVVEAMLRQMAKDEADPTNPLKVDKGKAPEVPIEQTPTREANPPKVDKGKAPEVPIEEQPSTTKDESSCKKPSQPIKTPMIHTPFFLVGDGTFKPGGFGHARMSVGLLQSTLVTDIALLYTLASNPQAIRAFIRRRFFMVHVNENYSSVTCDVCNKRMKFNDKNNKRFYKCSDCPGKPIKNRDFNACINFTHIFLSLITIGIKPEAFQSAQKTGIVINSLPAASI
jgi:hypothetical protein